MSDEAPVIPDPDIATFDELARALTEAIRDLIDRQEAVEKVLLEMAGPLQINAAEAFRARVKARRRRG